MHHLIITHLLPVIEHFRILSYFALFFISIVESLAFIGFTIPGTVVIMICGFMARNGVLDLEMIFVAVFCGVLAGEWASFYLGKKGTKLFKDTNKIFKPVYLEKGETFFKKHGSKSIFFGRFIGALRPVLPFLAGTMKMSNKIFFIFTAASVVLWTSLYLALGYFFGSAWHKIERFSNRAGLVMTLIIITVILVSLINKSLKAGKLEKK